jgi:hypothetical protein
VKKAAGKVEKKVSAPAKAAAPSSPVTTPKKAAPKKAKTGVAAPAKPTVKKPAVPKPVVEKPVVEAPSQAAEADTSSPAPAHISPEEAVAHIQALLQAKQERVKQGPAWPGATSVPHGDNGNASNHNGNHSSENVHNHVAHARGDQGKNGKS